MWHHVLAGMLLAAAVAGSPLAAAAQNQPDKGTARAIACAQKSTAAEAAICLDRDLVRRDAQIAEAYGQLRRNLPPRLFRPIEADQRQWRIDRNRCGAQVPCLATSYQNRLTVLEQVLGTVANPAKHNPTKRDALRLRAGKQ